MNDFMEYLVLFIASVTNEAPYLDNDIKKNVEIIGGLPKNNTAEDSPLNA